jgi:hypothetical protein
VFFYITSAVLVIHANACIAVTNSNSPPQPGWETETTAHRISMFLFVLDLYPVSFFLTGLSPVDNWEM